MKASKTELVILSPTLAEVRPYAMVADYKKAMATSVAQGICCLVHCLNVWLEGELHTIHQRGRPDALRKEPVFQVLFVG